MGLYDYKELLDKAMAERTFEAFDELASWLYHYDIKSWNGECYNLENGYYLYPISKIVDEKNEEFEVVDYELRP